MSLGFILLIVFGPLKTMRSAEFLKKTGETTTPVLSSSAVMTTDVIDPQGTFLGGFACEYSGSGTKEEAEDSLAQSITGIIKRRGYGSVKDQVKMYTTNTTDKGYKIHPGKIFTYESLKVKEEHGSVLTAICFVSHKYRELSNTKTMKTRKNRK